MGACLGKKSRKNVEKNRRYSSPKSPETAKDDALPTNSTPPTTPFLVNETDDIRISMIDEQFSLNSELQDIIDQQDMINETLARMCPARVVSVTESQFEYELANLIFGNPEQDYKESAFLPTTTAPS